LALFTTPSLISIGFFGEKALHHTFPPLNDECGTYSEDIIPFEFYIFNTNMVSQCGEGGIWKRYRKRIYRSLLIG
jgi:hypothetical protein